MESSASPPPGLRSNVLKARGPVFDVGVPGWLVRVYYFPAVRLYSRHCSSLGCVPSSVFQTPQQELLREAMWDHGKM